MDWLSEVVKYGIFSLIAWVFYHLFTDEDRPEVLKGQKNDTGLHV